MNKRILDTNRLIQYWKRRRNGRAIADISAEEAASWAMDMIKDLGSRGILTPVRIEFLCGAMSQKEVQLYEAFLGELEVVDQGHIIDDDWSKALQYARRVRDQRGGRQQRVARRDRVRPRKLGDCLIRAIADRLRYDVDTADLDMPRPRK